MKKGQVATDLKTVILALVMLAIMFFVAKAIIGAIIDSGNSKACLLSVQAAHYGRGAADVSLRCDTDFEYEKYKSKNKEDAEKKLAELMWRCWDQFGQGKYNVFDYGATQKNAHCFICSKYSFDTDTHAFTHDEFVEFLKKTDIPTTKTKYYDFLEPGLLLDPTKAETAVLADNLDDPNIDRFVFVESMNFDKYKDNSWFTRLTGSVPSLLTGDLDSIFERYFFVPYLHKYPRLYHRDNANPNYYAVVFYQVDKSYLRSAWWGKLAEIGLEKVDDDWFERVPRPSYVFVTRYDNMPDIGCDVLQG